MVEVIIEKILAWLKLARGETSQGNWSWYRGSAGKWECREDETEDSRQNCWVVFKVDTQGFPKGMEDKEGRKHRWPGRPWRHWISISIYGVEFAIFALNLLLSLLLALEEGALKIVTALTSLNDQKKCEWSNSYFWENRGVIFWWTKEEPYYVFYLKRKCTSVKELNIVGKNIRVKVHFVA